MTSQIERVVVRLDATSDNWTSIDTAVRLAAQTKAPLHGVFVEDQELLHLANLPFAKQVTVGAGAEPLTHDSIELQLRAQAERAHRDLIAAATRHQVKFSFEITRGAAGIASSSERELVVTGGWTRAVSGRFRIERRWSAVEIIAGPVLLAHTSWTAPGSVVALLGDRGVTAARLLEAAAQIAAAKGCVLHVICPVAVASGDGFDSWIAERAASHRVKVHIEVSPAGPSALRQRLGELDCRLLALDPGLLERYGESLRQLVQRISCDILIVP